MPRQAQSLPMPGCTLLTATTRMAPAGVVQRGRENVISLSLNFFICKMETIMSSSQVRTERIKLGKCKNCAFFFGLTSESNPNVLTFKS